MFNIIDLLWAEAARLEDLSPSDSRSAAEAKKVTGHLNRKRVFDEVIRISGIGKIMLAIKLSTFLKYAEYSSKLNWKGLNKRRLDIAEKEWVDRLLIKR